MTQQSNTTESDLAYADAREKYMLGEDGNDWFNRCVAMLECARKLERERDTWRKEAQEYRSLLYGCSNHGLWNGLSCIGCVEAERDQLRKVVDELAKAVALAVEFGTNIPNCVREQCLSALRTSLRERK